MPTKVEIARKKELYAMAELWGFLPSGHRSPGRKTDGRYAVPLVRLRLRTKGWGPLTVVEPFADFLKEQFDPELEVRVLDPVKDRFSSDDVAEFEESDGGIGRHLVYVGRRRITRQELDRRYRERRKERYPTPEEIAADNRLTRYTAIDLGPKYRGCVGLEWDVQVLLPDPDLERRKLRAAVGRRDQAERRAWRKLEPLVRTAATVAIGRPDLAVDLLTHRPLVRWDDDGQAVRWVVVTTWAGTGHRARSTARDTRATLRHAARLGVTTAGVEQVNPGRYYGGWAVGVVTVPPRTKAGLRFLKEGE